MAQLVVSAAGAAVGFFVGGPAGAQYGWALGSLVGSLAFAPTQKNQGPRLEDLKVTGTDYGQPIPWVRGTVRTGGQLIWSSDRREIATTTRQDGKGGPKVENTTYTYEVDALFLLSSNELEGVFRIWQNGNLEFNVDDAADSTTLVSSVQTDLWRAITVYTGAPGQLPDPTYEAAIGAGYAPAYLGCCTVLIQGLQLGNSGQFPQLTFEVSNKATPTIYSDAKDYSPLATPTTPSGTVVSSPSLFGSAFDTQAGGSGVIVGSSVGPFELGASDFCWDGFSYANGVLLAQTVFSSVSSVAAPIGGMKLIIQTAFGGVPRLEWKVYNGSLAEVVSIYGTDNVPAGEFFHWCVQKEGNIYTLFLNGVPQGQVSTATPIAGGQAPEFHGNQAGVEGVGLLSGFLEDVAVTTAARYEATGFVPRTEQYIPDQTTILHLPFYRIDTATRGSETIREVVEAICARAGLQPDQYDASGLDVISKPVRGLAISQVGNARSILEMLGTAFFFQAVPNEKIVFLPRGRAPVASIPFKDLGVAIGLDGSDDPLTLRFNNDIEAPAQEAVTYSNFNDDYQSDTQFSDRLLSSQESTATTTLPMVFTPSEAKGIADARLTDAAIAVIGTNLALSRKYSHLTSGDSVLVTDEFGSVYRMLIGRLTAGSGVNSVEARLEEPSAFTQAGITSDAYEGQTTVRATPGTLLSILDIPLLRDADDEVGMYSIARGLSSPWPGGQALVSSDDVQYASVATHTEAGIAGFCTTALGDWTGGNVFDELSTVTVNVGPGSLSSYTAEQVLAGTAMPYLIGREIIFAKVASLQSAGVYRLSGLLRGRRGTEQHQTGHVTNERFAALQPTGMRRITFQNSELGATRYFRGVTLGRLLSTAASQETVVGAVSEQPFSGVNARADRTTADTTITWNRRTRLATRFLGPLSSSVPLGEASEAYEVDIFNGSSVVRTLTSTTPSVVYSAANQVTDFGVAQTSLSVRIYQMSETVGRGFPLIATI